MIIDLHSHSSASDGSLSPAELVERARVAEVDVLSITDHDTVAGIMALDTTLTQGITLLPGIELSSRWNAIGVHIVGLNIALDSPELHDGIALQQHARHARASLIAARLVKKGFPDLLPGVLKVAGQSSPGRPHFAQQLIQAGIVSSADEAFRKYLGAGKLGDIKSVWAPLEEVIGWVRAAGGTAVLAHPDKYRLTRTKLNALMADFKAAGGEAIEVVSGHQSAEKTRNMADLCKRSELLASCGSDFHKPGLHWAEVGKHSTLPGDCRPVWDLW